MVQSLLAVHLQFFASGHTKWEHRLAVISPYAQQVLLLRRTIKAVLGISEGKSCPVDVNTVDGFQVNIACFGANILLPARPMQLARKSVVQTCTDIGKFHWLSFKLPMPRELTVEYPQEKSTVRADQMDLKGLATLHVIHPEKRPVFVCP